MGQEMLKKDEIQKQEIKKAKAKKSKKQKKLKKLRKTHIWPAFLLFFISLFSSVILCSAFASMFCSYVIESKYSQAKAVVEQAQNMIAVQKKQGDDLKQAIQKIAEYGIEVTDCVYLDEDEQVIEQYGEDTAELKLGDFEFFGNNMNFYFDSSQDNIMLNEDELDFQFGQIIAHTLAAGFLSTDPEWLAQSLAEYELWITAPTEKDDVTFVMKQEISVLRSDMIYVCIAAILALVILAVPMVLLFINVLGVFANQARMRKLIFLDETTGGKNWLAFRETATRNIRKYSTKNKEFAVLDFEIMKFRSYCACHGVEEGDYLLENVSNRLSRALGKNEVCGRYGRANFAVLLCMSDKSQVTEKIEKLFDALQDVGGKHRIVSHAGYSFLDDVKNEAGQSISRKKLEVAKVYNNASAARASIPSNEDNMLAGFSQKMLEDQLWEHQVEDLMEEALAKKEFAVYYQPKYNPVNDELAGAEALIRWIRPDGSIVPPGKFIPIFENNGFITKIDDYMISNVAKQQAQWLSEGKNVVPVSVNVSRAHFTQADLAEHILELVDAYQTPHHLVEIELTESAFFDDKNALLTTVNKLKNYGFEISMDDFGAGYSSLNSLKDLPLDVLKLDAEFFRGDLRDDRGEIVVTEAITLAKQLHMRIVAEGIEKKEQVDFLKTAGCDMIQGYYFAKPMPSGDYEERMEQKAYTP